MKEITFVFNEKPYTLRFTRTTIGVMEDQGFNIDLIDEKPIKMLPLFVKGAFIACHPDATEEEIDEIYDCIPDKRGFINHLCEMYIEQVEALIGSDDDEKDESKNIAWTANW